MENTKVYEEKLLPLINQIRIICNDNKIPMFMSYALTTDENEIIYKNDIIDSDFVGVTLVDDKIKEHMKIMAGFQTIYPTSEVEEIIMY